MKSSKERLAEAQQQERVLKKTLVNDFISLKEHLVLVQDENDIYKRIIQQGDEISNIYPEFRDNIKHLETARIDFDDYDIPIFFEKLKEEKRNEKEQKK